MLSFDEIKAKLPSFLDTTSLSNISKLVELIFTELQTLEEKLDEIQTNRDVDTAFENGLDKLGVNIGLSRQGLIDEEYREKLKLEQAINRSDGTIETLLEIIQTQFGVIDKSDIIIEELGDAKIRVSIPLADALGEDETFEGYKELLDRIKAAGIKVFTEVTGSFAFDDEDFGFSDLAETVGGTFGGVV